MEHKTIAEWCKEIEDNCQNKGWNDKLDNSVESLGVLLTNVHGEVSEAWEELRANKGISTVYYNEGNPKPEGFAMELADTVIRIMHICGHYGINLEQCIAEKMEYNKTRPYRHGNKAA